MHEPDEELKCTEEDHVGTGEIIPVFLSIYFEADHYGTEPTDMAFLI